jgi:ABC-type lipoprotein release transport system permease subunit
LATAIVLSRSIGEYLFRVSPLDAWAYGFVAAILAVVVLMASYVPARRAGRTDPLIALKGL